MGIIDKLKTAVIFFLFLVFSSYFPVFSQEIQININAATIKNSNFYQLLGGYLDHNVDLENPELIASFKEMLPQDKENPVVVQTSPTTKFSWVVPLNDDHVKKIIRFCKEVNCDPMFAAITVQFKSVEDVRQRVRLVKNECRQVFGDDRHCLHWDIGDEPSSVPQACEDLADWIHKSGLVIKEEIPNAILQVLELYNLTAKVRGTEETIGECIVRKINEKTPKLKLDVLKMHWYPYSGEYDILRRNPTKGNEVLTLWEGKYHESQSFLYPRTIVQFMSDYAQKYEVSQGAEIGIGELNLSDQFMDYASVVSEDDIIPGCCWLRKNYKSDLTLNCDKIDPCSILTGQKPLCCGAGRCSCKIPSNFETKRLNLTWGGAFWYLDVLPIAAEAGIKYIQKHTYIGNAAFDIIGPTGKKTPTGEIYKFLSRYFGKKILETSSNDPALVNAHSALNKDGSLRILLINKSVKGEKKNLRIKINNFTINGPATAYIIRVPNNDFNSEDTTNLQVEKKEGIIVSNEFNYEIEPYTAVILKIGGQEKEGEKINLKAGFNLITWQKEWGEGIEIKSLPLTCPFVSFWENNWFSNLAIPLITNGNFIPEKKYYIFCLKEESLYL